MTKQNWMGIVVGILFASSLNGQVGRLEWRNSIELPMMQNGKPSIGVAGPIAGLSNGYLLIGGGANFPDLPPWEGGAKEIQRELFVYSKKGKTVHLLARDTLAEAVAYAASLCLPNGLFVIGGETQDGKTNACHLINFDKDTGKITALRYPDLPAPLSNMGAVCIENKIFIVGGEFQDAVSDQILQLDLNNLAQGWIQVGTLPYAASHLQLLADKSHNLFVVGGRKANKDTASTLYQTVLKSSDGGRHWEKLTEIPFKAAAAVACILPDDGLWLLSADRGTTFHRVETLIFEAKRASDQQEAKQLIEVKNQLQRNHPGFGREIWRYDLSYEKWKKTGELPSNAPVTTTAVVWDDMIVLPSGEVKAGVRSPKILLATFLK